MRAQHDISQFEDVVERNAGPRLALAGGSDRPPPGQDETSADVIRFPLERVRPAKDQHEEPAPDNDESSEVDAQPAETGALWAAWLSGVLSSSSAGRWPGA